MNRYNYFFTGWGTGAVVYSEKGLTGVLFPCQDETQLEEELHQHHERASYDDTAGIELCSTLELYFAGKCVSFDERLDIKERTGFEIAVYEKLKAVHYGDTITYRMLAELCGSPKAARAVGNTMRKNPVPIVIPCHRVLRSNGTIGGWSGKPGWKERLLYIEGHNNFQIIDEVIKEATC